MIKRDHYKPLYAPKIDNLDENNLKDRNTKVYSRKKKIDNLKNPLCIKYIVVKSLNQRKVKDKSRLLHW